LKPWAFRRCRCGGASNDTKELSSEAHCEIRSIFNAPDEAQARRLLERFVKCHQTTAPRLARWADDALPRGFTVFGPPGAHRRRLRTTNALERVNREIKRRTRVAPSSPTRKPACAWWPLWRLYNDRFAQADSNHRFVASPAPYFGGRAVLGTDRPALQ
jgi:hypothetical protein